MQISAENNQNQDGPYMELRVSGSFCLEQTTDTEVEVRRGMVILTSEGQEAGRVAAVIIDQPQHEVTRILLSRLSQMTEYRLVPLTLIEKVYGEKVLLRILNQDVDTLPTWQGS